MIAEYIFPFRTKIELDELKKAIYEHNNTRSNALELTGKKLTNFSMCKFKNADMYGIVCKNMSGKLLTIEFFEKREILIFNLFLYIRHIIISEKQFENILRVNFSKLK